MPVGSSFSNPNRTGNVCLHYIYLLSYMSILKPAEPPTVTQMHHLIGTKDVMSGKLS